MKREGRLPLAWLVVGWRCSFNVPLFVLRFTRCRDKRGSPAKPEHLFFLASAGAVVSISGQGGTGASGPAALRAAAGAHEMVSRPSCPRYRGE